MSFGTAQPRIAPIDRDALTIAWRRNPPLFALVAAMLVLFVVSLVGLFVDPRVITGAPAWLKPAKFAASIAIYGATLLWLLRYIPDRPRLVRTISWIALIGFAIEMALITITPTWLKIVDFETRFPGPS